MKHIPRKYTEHTQVLIIANTENFKAAMQAFVSLLFYLENSS